MPNTPNFGFPLWADSPPQGATGKTLRDTIIGTSTGSLANMIDAKLQELASDKESVSNKVATYDGYGDGWNGASTETYPSTKAVNDFVTQRLSYYLGIHDYITLDVLFKYYSSVLKFSTIPPLVDIDTFQWDGNTEELSNFLGMFYKISNSTKFPDTFKVSTLEIDKDTGEATEIPLYKDFALNSTISDLKDTFGIVVYGMRIENYFQPVVVVADRAGILPAAVIEQMMGSNPGIDVPYEAGTYVYYQGGDSLATFVSKATQCISVKSYIDNNGANITDTFVSWDGGTDGLPSVLGMFYKVSDNTYVPNEIVYRYANKSSDGTVTLDEDYLAPDGFITDLAADYGIYIVSFNGHPDGIIIVKRCGVLPAAVASAITGMEVPTDVPYESGTYVVNVLLSDGETRRYVTEAFYTISTKAYIDQKFEELKMLIQGTNEGGNV